MGVGWWQYCPMSAAAAAETGAGRRGLGRRLPRWAPALGLALLLHAWLLDWVTAALSPAPRGTAPRTVWLRPAVPPQAATAALASAPATMVRPRPNVPPRTVAAAPPPAPTPTPVPPQALVVEPPAEAGRDEPAPPVYPAQPLPPAQADYALHYGAEQGRARLVWQHDGQRYRLLLDGVAERAGGPLPLVEQRSQGGFDAAGLAPLRFTDRRRGRAAQAANFDAAGGRILFSGPRVEHPAWPGAQDRLALLLQLAAIAAAAGEPPPRATVFVVDARGLGARWQFERSGPEAVATPLGTALAWKLQREPARAEDLRVEVWLDPARGFWPLKARYTALRSGDVFELALAGEPRPTD